MANHLHRRSRMVKGSLHVFWTKKNIENVLEPVLGDDPAHDLGHRQGPPHEGSGVENEDAADVEEEVAESDLQGAAEAVAVGGQRSQQASGGGANVGT